MDIYLIIIFAFAPVPLFHLWLHALLPFWKKNPALFYVLCIFLWVFSFLFLKKISEILPHAYYAGDFQAILGFLLAGLGFTFVAFSILSIGAKRFFVWAVLKPSSTEQKRITSGLFKTVPHPAYLGEILISLGLFFLSGKFYLLLVFFFLFCFLPISIYFEEKELSERIRV